jgi:hypothetical protein
MTAYSGPSAAVMREQLTLLVQGGMDPDWIVEEAAWFLSLRIVLDHCDDSSEPLDDDGEASQDPRVIAFAVMMRQAIKRLGSRSARRLLRGVLGMYPETQKLKLKDRREFAGRHFRGLDSPRSVTGGTIRTHHEPQALEQLSHVLVKMEAEQRGEQLAQEVITVGS